MNKPQYNGQNQTPMKEGQGAVKQNEAPKQAPMKADTGPMHDDE